MIEIAQKTTLILLFIYKNYNFVIKKKVFQIAQITQNISNEYNNKMNT